MELVCLVITLATLVSCSGADDRSSDVIVFEVFTKLNASSVEDAIASALTMTSQENATKERQTHVHDVSMLDVTIAQLSKALDRAASASNHQWNALIGPGDVSLCDVMSSAVDNRTLFVAVQQCEVCGRVTSTTSVVCALPSMSDIGSVVTSLLRRFRWQHVVFIATSRCAWKIRELYIFLKRQQFIVDDVIVVTKLNSDDVTQMDEVEGDSKGLWESNYFSCFK